LHIQRGPWAGRLNVAVADPTDPNVMYVAGDSSNWYGDGSGIWKTTDWLDRDPVWTPLTDDQSSLDISFHGLAIAPTDHNTLYAAANGPDGGILKTTDGGAHWQMLAQSQFAETVFGAIVVSPVDANTVFVATGTAPQPFAGGLGGGLDSATGLWRSTDGGMTFNSITPTSLQGASVTDLAIEPGIPTEGGIEIDLYAGVTNAGDSKVNGIYKVTDATAVFSTFPAWEQQVSSSTGGAPSAAISSLPGHPPTAMSCTPPSSNSTRTRLSFACEPVTGG
jgi:hypothetical protein